jgi:hypothetical protein
MGLMQLELRARAPLEFVFVTWPGQEWMELRLWPCCLMQPVEF